MKPVQLFPVFLKIEGRPCLVVGAGTIGEEKIQGLLHAEAEICVVAPQATARVQAWAREGKLRWERRKFRPSDLKGTFMVVAATSSPALHEKIYKAARRKSVLCNVVDDPEHCDFYYGSVIRRGALQIAISSAGQSPALAQRIRKELEQQFGVEYEGWLKELGEARERLFSRPVDGARRKALLHRLASKAALEEFRRRQKRRSRASVAK